MKLNMAIHVPYLANRVASRMVAAFYAETGVEIKHWRVVALLWARDGMRVGELASESSIEASTLSRVLKRMENLRLISRRHSREDARSVTVHLAKAGRELAERLTPVAAEYEAVMLRGFSKQEIQTLRKLLVRAFENLDELDGRSS